LDGGALLAVLEDFALEPLPICILYPSRELPGPARKALIESLVARPPPASFTCVRLADSSRCWHGTVLACRHVAPPDVEARFGAGVAQEAVRDAR